VLLNTFQHSTIGYKELTDMKIIEHLIHTAPLIARMNRHKPHTIS